jgi:transposase
MSQIKRIGLNTSKAVFTLHSVDESGRTVPRTNLRRAKMVTFFKNLAPAEIALEECGSSHHWGRDGRSRPRGAPDPAAIRKALREAR